MAVIAPFLQRQLYDEAATEMADELRHKVDLLACSDSDISDNDAKGTARPHWELPKGANVAATDRADEVLVRKRTNMSALRHRNRPGTLTGPDKVSNWLLGSKDWSRQFLRSHGGISSPIIRKSRRSTGAVSSVLGFERSYSGGPTRHVVPYEEFNNWWLRFNLRGRLEDAFPVLAPNTHGRTSWDIFVLTLVLYSAVTVPLAFSYGLPSSPALNAVEWVLTFVYIVDIGINFRTAYHDDDGNLVRDSWPVAHRYLSTWFPIDFLATVPFDFIGLAAGLGDSESQLIILAVLKTPRLLRLVKLMRLLDRVRNANLFKVLQLILLMMMIAHWLACAWYVIARYAPGSNDWGFDTLDDENRLTWYLSAFYYSFLLLIGDNIQAMNNYERLFFILALVAGACFYSAVVGNMALLVANMNTVAVRFRQKLDMTQDALRYMRVPEAQRERVQAFYDFITQFSHPGSEGLGFLSELTKGINEDLHIFLHSGNLMRIYLFKDCEPAFIRSLAMRMKIVVFIPGEVIFRQGDLGHEMYIIRAGCVAVVSKNSEVMSLLQAGDFFGEIALLTQSRRTAKCIALSNCDLAILNSFDIKILMKEFPKSAHSLQEAARDRLRQLQIAGRAGKGSSYDDDEGDGDEDPDKRQEREEVRRQRRSSITRFTTGRGVYSHEVSPAPSDGRTGGSSCCIDGTPQVSPLPPLAAAPRQDQVAWTTAAPIASAGGSATAEKQIGDSTAGAAAATTEPSDGLDSNLLPASYVESSRNSCASLATEDSAREFASRRRTNSVTSQGGPSNGASASNSRCNSGAGATAAATVAGAAGAPLHNTAANGDVRLQCSGGCSEPQSGATAVGLCDGGGGSGEPAAAAVATVSSTATPQVRPPMNKIRRRSSTAEGVRQNHPNGGSCGGGQGATSNPNLSEPAAVAAAPRPQRPPSPHVRNPTPSSSSWSALFTRRLEPRPGTPGVFCRRARSRSSTSGEGTATSVEGQPTVLRVTSAAMESPAPAVGASVTISSTSDGTYLDATTRFDAVERFHPPGPMSPVVLPTSAVSPVAVQDAVPTAKKFRASVLLFGRAIGVGPLAEAVEQSAPLYMKQAATLHTKLRAAAAPSSRDGSSSGMAAAACLTTAVSRDPSALQPMGNSRRTSIASIVESRPQVLSPGIKAAPGRREHRSSLILPYSASSTTEFAAAVAAAMGITSPLLDGGGGSGGDGRGRVAAGAFVNALAATAASVAGHGAGTGSVRRGSTEIEGSRVVQGLITSHDGEAQSVPQIHRHGSSTLCVPLRTWYTPPSPSDGVATATAAFMEATALRTPEGAALSSHLNAQGPCSLMRSAAARRADAIHSPFESPFSLRGMAVEGQGAGVQSPPFRLSPSATVVNLAGATNGKLQADRATAFEDGNAFSYSALEGTTRNLRALGSMELLQLAPPGYEETLAEGAGDGTGTGCLRSSGSGTGPCPSADRLVRTRQIRNVRRSLQSGAGTLPEAFSTTAAAAAAAGNMTPEEMEAGPRRDNDGGAAAAAAPAVVASEDGGDEGLTPVMEWISTARATTAKARRQRRQSSVGFFSPQPQLRGPLPGAVNGQSPFAGAHVRAANQLAELQCAEAEHMRREAALARRESDLEHREAELALRHAEAVAALAEATQRREEAAAAMRRTRSVHVMVVALASACADLAFKVEQLDLRLEDTTAAVGRIEAQHGHGRPHGNEFLGLGQSAVTALPARDTRPGVLERNASIDKRFAALERTKALSLWQSSGGGGGGGGGGGSMRHGNSLLHGAGEIATGSGDVTVSGRRLAIPTSSGISGVESKEAAAAAAATAAAAAASSKIRRSSALRADVFTTTAPSPPPSGFVSRGAISFSMVPTSAGQVRDSTSPSPSAAVRGTMAESFTAGMQVAVPAAAVAVAGAAAPASTNPLMLFSAALGNSFRKARQESPWSQHASSGAVPATGLTTSASAASGAVHTEVAQQPITVKSSEIEEQ